MSAVIELAGVDVLIAGACVLRAIDLQVRAGERVALCGPNGAGKSTLLDVVVGVRRPDRGSARVLGRAPPARALGFVPQDAGASLLPWLSVRQNLAVPLRIRGRGAHERDRAVELAAALVDPEATIDLDAAPDALSGGQRQRVALMRALAGRPAVLVWDEPFSAIDARARAQVRALLRELCRPGGLSLLIATHDAADVRELEARVVELDSRTLLGGVGRS